MFAALLGLFSNFASLFSGLAKLWGDRQQQNAGAAIAENPILVAHIDEVRKADDISKTVTDLPPSGVDDGLRAFTRPD